MVYMATAIESDDLLIGELEGEIVRDESVQLGGQSGVEIGYVGLMMFGVVGLHYLGADGWFEGLWGCKRCGLVRCPGQRRQGDRKKRVVKRSGVLKTLVWDFAGDRYWQTYIVGLWEER